MHNDLIAFINMRCHHGIHTILDANYAFRVFINRSFEVSLQFNDCINALFLMKTCIPGI